MSVKFYCDINLLRLCKWLRFLGFDTVTYPELSKSGIQNLCIKDRRVFLTRNKKLHKLLCKVEIISDENYILQLQAILAKYKYEINSISSRCMKCNKKLKRINNDAHLNLKAKSPNLLDSIPKDYYQELSYCPKCGNFYWKGSHYNNMLEVINTIS